MAAPVVVAAVVAAAVQAVGAAIAHAVKNGKKAQADRILQEASTNLNIPLPEFKEMIAQELQKSELSGIKHDPELLDAQMAAFDALGEIRDSGGLTLQDQTALNDIQNDVARQEKAGRGQITNEMAQRGTLGSGAEVAMKLSNQQNAAQRQSEAGMDTAANAQQRYWDSILAQSDMAGQIRGQNWDEQSEVARANDAIARYNAGARTDAHQYNNSLRQTQFGNRFGLAQAKNNIATARANVKIGEAGDASNLVASTGKGIADVTRAAGSYAEDDDDKDGR